MVHLNNLKDGNEHTIYNVLQTHEVDEHKYYLSQKRGRECTIEEAFKSWCYDKFNGVTHAEIWSLKYLKHKKELLRRCKKKCPRGCMGYENCKFSKVEIHEVLDD